ncbi:MAG TPA: hypothetical protein VIP28_09135 [Nocardioides sp.]
MTARKAASATAPAGSEDAETKAADEAKAAEEAAAAAEAKAAEEAAAEAAAKAAAEEAAADEDDDYDSFLASLSLSTAVHVQVDDRYQAFPAGTRIGDVVNGVEFSEELATTVTNEKAWVIPTQDD